MNKNREMLKSKRDRLLHKLLVNNVIDKMEYELAMEEEIPEELRAFPHKATHLLMRLKKKHPLTHEFVTNLDSDIQKSTFKIADRHYKELRKNGINNVAIIVAETQSGKVKAYIGNTGIFDKNGESAFVDIPSSSRSTGSILKPFLYSNMLSRGEILPNSLVPDIPTRFGNFSPENYNLEYEGAVPSSSAIARSLNVPAVHMLRTHGIDVFLNDLHQLGIKSINRSASNYGLSLILGGAEARLDELTAAYASMGRRLIHYQTFNGKYFESDVHPLSFLPRDTFPISTQLNEAQLSAAGIWHCFEAMKTLKRPNNQGNWEYFNSDQAIAWKTGTSYGFRDAWAIGVTPDYVVGVWVGNADGEGRPGLIGLLAAAPILFDVFENLPAYKQWFSEPWDDMVKMPICKESGYIASENCNNIDSVWIPKAGYNFKQCPYHKLYHLDSTGEFQVNASCYPTSEMKHISIFVLPPVMEWYYKQSHPWYKGLPPTSPNCTFSQNKIMQFIYPDDNMKIYLPIDLNGIKQKVLFEAAHQNSKAQIFWHIDEEYITTTQGHHQISALPKVGKHTLTILDEEGNKLTHRFEIISERE
jgi:penicillin-binding protein 1C